jgi:hypothetical protein
VVHALVKPSIFWKIVWTCGRSTGTAALSFYTFLGCHRLSLHRDLHSNLAVIADMFSQNDSAATGGGVIPTPPARVCFNGGSRVIHGGRVSRAARVLTINAAPRSQWVSACLFSSSQGALYSRIDL